jgi:hypothetical protein
LLSTEAESEGFAHIPGWVPDPLLDENAFALPAGETHAFWISVRPRQSAPPGSHKIRVGVTIGKTQGRSHEVQVEVSDVELAPRRHLRVTNWFYCDALLDFYECKAFDEKFWAILPAYLRNLAEHGQDTLYVPLLTQATDGVKRPTQLLHITRRPKSAYSFDWDMVRRFIQVAREAGIDHFEWPHLFTQWGAKQAIQVYAGHEGKPLWGVETEATSSTYRRFLEQLLPELYEFLEREELLERSFFHISDEPRQEHLESYRAAREMVGSIAPWMRSMDALSNVSFARDRLTDIPVAAADHAMPFIQEGIPCWCYFCCSQRGPYINRLLDTPLAKIRMNGWLFYRFEVEGFLHWGANYWYRRATRNLIDPFSVLDAHSWPNWPAGDPFVIYPGPDGPIDSIRWEVFAESLQDYALLRTAQTSPGGRLLAGIVDFGNFPKSEAWIQKTRRRLLAAASEGSTAP